MKKLPSKQEWLILEALWRKNPMFLSELMREMEKSVSWKQTTFSTYLKKMFEAGLIGYETISGNRSYYPLVNREECVMEESRALCEKLSRDSARLLIACMLRESGLSYKELCGLAGALGEVRQSADG